MEMNREWIGKAGLQNVLERKLHVIFVTGFFVPNLYADCRSETHKGKGW